MEWIYISVNRINQEGYLANPDAKFLLLAIFDFIRSFFCDVGIPEVFDPNRTIPLGGTP